MQVEADPKAASYIRRTSAKQLFLIAVWFALVGGVGEALIVLFKGEVLGEFVWTNTDIVWMAPLSYLVYFGVAALLLSFLQAVPRMQAKPAWHVFVFAVLTVSCLLSAVGGVHWVAIVLLGCGVAFQLARAAGNWSVFARLVRRSTIVLFTAVLVFTVGLFATRRGTERRLLKPPPSSSVPNVVFIVLDAVRAASMSLYGYGQPTTPNLDRWAARGVVFERAIATAPWTLPSHASMFTGRWPHELSSDWFAPLDQKYPTIAEAFLADGYVTTAISANYFYATREAGLARGIVHFQGRPQSIKQILYSSVIGQKAQAIFGGERINERVSDRKDAKRITNAAVEFLSAADRPFYLFMNYFDAHKPYEGGAAGETLEDLEVTRGGYDAAITSIDKQVDRLLRALEQRGLLNNTIVVITADHGETFGEHGQRGHGHSLYLTVLRVPLVLIAPGLPAGARVTQAVSLRDLAATLADLANLRASIRFGGASLARYWQRGRAPDTAMVVSEVWPGRNKLPKKQPVSRGEMVSMIRDSLHYILNGDATEELYNIDRDPFESVNLIASRDSVLNAFRPAAHAARAALMLRFRPPID